MRLDSGAGAAAGPATSSDDDDDGGDGDEKARTEEEGEEGERGLPGAGRCSAGPTPWQAAPAARWLPGRGATRAAANDLMEMGC